MTKRSECTCPCHTGDSSIIHCVPCCEPDEGFESEADFLSCCAAAMGMSKEEEVSQ